MAGERQAALLNPGQRAAGHIGGKAGFGAQQGHPFCLGVKRCQQFQNGAQVLRRRTQQAHDPGEITLEYLVGRPAMVPEHLLSGLGRLRRGQGQPAAVGAHQQVNLIVGDQLLGQAADSGLVAFVVFDNQRDGQLSVFGPEPHPAGSVHVADIALQALKDLTPEQGITATQRNSDSKRDGVSCHSPPSILQ